MPKVADTALEKKQILNSYRGLLRTYKHSGRGKADVVLIRKAFNIALDAHKDMRRKSGEPYIRYAYPYAQK